MTTSQSDDKPEGRAASVTRSERDEERVRGQARVLLSQSNDKYDDQSGRVTTRLVMSERDDQPV